MTGIWDRTNPVIEEPRVPNGKGEGDELLNGIAKANSEVRWASIMTCDVSSAPSLGETVEVAHLVLSPS